MKFCTSVLYLGVRLGPGALETQWNSAIRKYNTAVNDILRLGLGFVASVSLYNMCAHSCLAWLAAVVQPSRAVILAERKALCRLVRGPWCSVPSHVLFHLKNYGFPVQVNSIVHASIAGRCRNSCKTSHGYAELMSVFRTAALSDDRVLRPSHWEWIQNSCVIAASNAHNRVRDILNASQLLEPAGSNGMQRKIHDRLRQFEFQKPLESTLAKRWARFGIGRSNHPNILHNIEHLHYVAVKYKPCVSAAVLKWWCNAINTSARFHKFVACCPWCAEADGDNIGHLLSCRAVAVTASKYWELNLPSLGKGFLGQLCLSHLIEMSHSNSQPYTYMYSTGYTI